MAGIPEEQARVAQAAMPADKQTAKTILTGVSSFMPRKYGFGTAPTPISTNPIEAGLQTLRGY